MTDDALIHLRVPTDTKARWVRSSRAAGMRPANGTVEWDVGTRVGAALRDARQRNQERSTSEPPGHHVRPHVRRAHWHTIVSGPRVRDGDPIPANARLRELRWLPPIAVNIEDLDAMPATIRPVPAR